MTLSQIPIRLGGYSEWLPAHISSQRSQDTWLGWEAPTITIQTFATVADDLYSVSADFPSVFKLANLDGENGFRIDGFSAFSYTGRSISDAGDLNLDGFNDIIIGSIIGPNDAPECFVVFGKKKNFNESVNLNELDGTNGFGINTAPLFGSDETNVSSAGDVNGDGIGDIIVGSRYSSPAEDYAGVSYVIFGSTGGFLSDVDLAALDGDNGFRLNGSNEGDASGCSVSSAGDFNGDGFDDLLIGAHLADPEGAQWAGSSYLIFGKAGGFTPSFDLAALDGANGFRLDGIDPRDRSGLSVSDAGDVNGDGFDDILIGAFGADRRNKDYVGETYVVFGNATAHSPSFSLSALDGTNGFCIVGIDELDCSGDSVSSAGDVNGDGFDDIIVSATNGDPHGLSEAGECYVIFGGSGGFPATLDMKSLNGRNGFRIDGAVQEEGIAVSVSGAGDVNGDGFDDLIIGAELGPSDGSRTGRNYVVFGKASDFPDHLDVASLDGNNGFRIDGIDPRDYGGWAVSSAGDMNGDGFADMLMSAWKADPGGVSQAGETYVVFGRAPSEAVERIGAAGDQRILGGDFDDTLRGMKGDDTLKGRAGQDRLFGNLGDDRLVADVGRDRLIGGEGADAFALSLEASAEDRPRIRDFGAEDILELSATVFGLAPGRLDREAFRANFNGRAKDADDRLLYDIAKGKLYFDADGDGAGARIQIATLEDAPALRAGDIIVI